MEVKDLQTRIVLCNLIYKEYKGPMSKLFCWLNFVKCTKIKRNFYVYLILALFGHGGLLKTFAYVVIRI